MDRIPKAVLCELYKTETLLKPDPTRVLRLQKKRDS